MNIGWILLYFYV